MEKRKADYLPETRHVIITLYYLLFLKAKIYSVFNRGAN